MSATAVYIVTPADGVLHLPTATGLSIWKAADVSAVLDVLSTGLQTTEPVAIGVWWMDGGQFTKSVGIPPAFTTQPSAQTVDDGADVTFTVVATNANTYQWQQSTDDSTWSDISGANSDSYAITGATNAAHNGTFYRCVATGDGGATSSTSAELSVNPPAPLTGISDVTVAISTQYLDPTWQAANRATVRVEKGWASGTFQDLYPHTDGNLYTSPNGGGTEADAWANGDRMFVVTPYNQKLASEAASGHPVAITDDSRRVLLDCSVDGSPAFAGRLQGTQDSNQHASERGYDLNLSIASEDGFTAISLDAGVGSTQYRPWQNNGGSTQNLLVQPANSRWFPSPGIAVANFGSSNATLPSLKIGFADEGGSRSTQNANHSVFGGAFQANSVAMTVNSTSTPMQIWGTSDSLVGRAWAFVLISGNHTTAAVVKYNGTLVPRLHGTSSAVYGANEIAVYSPKQYQSFPIDLSDSVGEIQVRCATAALREVEASFNGGAWASIGTTDEHGFLNGTLANQAAGSGTLSLRVAGQSTAATTVSTVRVGVVAQVLGQSNAIGRGDDYTYTSDGSKAANAWANKSSTDKSWTAKFLQDLATDKASPFAVLNGATGGSYLLFDASGSTDGRHGHWSPTNPGSTVTSDFNKSVAYSHLLDVEPNFAIWHQGESEASQGVFDASAYEAGLIAMWEEYQSRTGHSHKLWLMQIGRVGVSTDANVDRIRQAQVNAVANRSDLFEFGGCLAHLPVEDTLDSGQNVHFYTTAQKDSVAAVFQRHALGSGRGPRYSAGAKAGATITITLAGGVSPLTIDSGEAATPIGWKVTDDSGSATVTAVSVSGLTITLTCDRTLVGTTSIKWLSHYSGIGTTLLDSDATTPVPPEPFEASV